MYSPRGVQAFLDFIPIWASDQPPIPLTWQRVDSYCGTDDQDSSEYDESSDEDIDIGGYHRRNSHEIDDDQTHSDDEEYSCEQNNVDLTKNAEENSDLEEDVASNYNIYENSKNNVNSENNILSEGYSSKENSEENNVWRTTKKRKISKSESKQKESRSDIKDDKDDVRSDKSDEHGGVPSKEDRDLYEHPAEKIPKGERISPKNYDTFFLLNDDCLRIIFSYCNIPERLLLRSVCKKWSELCSYSVASTSKISINTLLEDMCESRSRLINNDLIEHRNVYLVNLELWTSFRKYVLSILSMIGGTLTHLTICEEPSFNYKQLDRLSDFCPNINALIYESPQGFNCRYRKYYSRVLKNKFASNLKTLVLPSNFVLNGTCLGRILECATKLDTLDLSVISPGPNDRIENYWSVVNGVTVLPKFPVDAPIRVLCLDRCEDLTRIPNPRLVTMLVNHADSSVKNFLIRMEAEGKRSALDFLLGDYHETLEHLDISRIDGIFEGMASGNNTRNCGKMSKLVCQGFIKKVCNLPRRPSTGQFNRQCSVSLAFLNRPRPDLDLANSEFTTTFKSIHLLNVLSLMPNLRVLDITLNCNLGKSPELIAEICDKVPLLEELILDKCRLYAKNLLPLHVLSNLKKLSINKLVECHLDESWEYPMYDEANFGYELFAFLVLPGLRQLTELSMENSKSLTDEHLLDLVNNAGRNLKTVFLGDCYRSLSSWKTLREKCQSVSNRTDSLTLDIGKIPAELTNNNDKTFLKFSGELIPIRRNHPDAPIFDWSTVDEASGSGVLEN